MAMTAQEKAKDLVTNFHKELVYHGFIKSNYCAKGCAKIAVEEIIKTFSDIDQRRDYWCEVLKEIDNI